MPCHLTFGALDFDPDAFAATLVRKPDHISRVGDRGGRQKHFVLSFDVSEADFDDLEDQIAETVAFLSANEQELKRLGELREVLANAWYQIDFGFSTRMFDQEVAIQMDIFPSKLLRLLGSINADLMVSQYPPLNNESDESGGEG